MKLLTRTIRISKLQIQPTNGIHSSESKNDKLTIWLKDPEGKKGECLVCPIPCNPQEWTKGKVGATCLSDGHWWWIRR